MLVVGTFYNSYKVDAAKGAVNVESDTIKVMLVTSLYTFDPDSHSFKNDVTNEVIGTGYTAGGRTIANLAVVKDNMNDKAVINGDNVLWSTVTLTARGAVVYKDTGISSTSPLLMYIDFGQDEAVAEDEFLLNWLADGVFQIT